MHRVLLVESWRKIKHTSVMTNDNTSEYVRKKKSLLINPQFQWKLIGYVGLLTLLILGTVLGLFQYGFQQFQVIGETAGLPADHIYFQFIQMQQSLLYNVLAVLSIIVALILLFGGLFISHKIAGPIYRMQKSLREMSANQPVELNEIKFRDKDFFPELADAFNELVRSYKSSK